MPVPKLRNFAMIILSTVNQPRQFLVVLAILAHTGYTQDF